MNYAECIEQARGRIGNYCKACVECNGRACRNQMPGPGAKGIGDTAMRNYDKWKEIRVQMDTIAENAPHYAFVHMQSLVISARLCTPHIFMVSSNSVPILAT
jgi:hypothetical protein